MNVFYLPDGPANLESLFPDVDFTKVTEYFLELQVGDTIVLTTPTYKMTNVCPDNVRIHFVNYLGGIDAINCCLQTIEQDTKSDSLEIPRRVFGQVSDPAISRLNIKSNDTYTLITDEFTEDTIFLLGELQDAPEAWITYNSDQIGAVYLPIVIKDATIEKIKNEDRYIYETIITFTFSNDRILIRSNPSQQNYYAQ